jgi:hypothetical protein
MTLLARIGLKRRLNLVIPSRAYERLSWLQGRTEAASQTEVIRNALFVYEILVERIGAGSTLMEKTTKGDLIPLPLSIDVTQPRLVARNPLDRSSDSNPQTRPEGESTPNKLGKASRVRRNGKVELAARR